MGIALLMVGCARELEPEFVQDEENGGIVLELVPQEALTRAGKDGVKDGVTEYNENLISGKVHLFFYANNATDDTPALKSVYADVNPTTRKVSLSTSVAEVRALFGGTNSGRKCKVFVIANYNGTTEINHESTPRYTRNQLKALVLATPTWKDICDGNGQFTPSETPAFVMTGEAEIESRGATASPVVDGEVKMARVASKVTFSLTVSDEIEVEIYAVDYRGNRIKVTNPETGEWTGEYQKKNVIMKPQKGGIVVNLCYANKYGLLSGESYQPTGTTDPKLFDYDYRPFTADGSVLKAQPFYSYPQKWGTGAANQPYLKLVIPWTPYKEDGTTTDGNTKNYYYKIPLPEGELKRNNWYQISLDVSILGGEEQEPIPVEIKYCVADWGAAAESDASVVSARYLSIPRKSFTMYNVEDLSIPMSSSHPVEITNVTISKPYYGTGTAPTFSRADIQRLEAVELSEIVFRHTIDNNINSSKFDCTPYTITFTARHADNHDYSYDIVIVQYPALYIIPEENYDYGDGGGINNHYGYVLVNNSRSTWGNVTGLSNSAQNQNKDMYIINVTRLESDSEYVIGDARQDNVQYYNPNPAFVQATAMEGGIRSLSYYYPTEESDRTKNMVSPAFRIASSYGVTNAISRDNARYRCASYQEDQYPAGRWRVPTRAEIAYIANLSAKGVIPVLFNPNGTYWSANGMIRVGNSGGTISDATGTSAFVRCVYDEWYWSEKDENGVETNVCTRGTFTWGDELK